MKVTAWLIHGTFQSGCDERSCFEAPPCVKDSFDGSRAGYRNISVMTQMHMTPVTSEFGTKGMGVRVRPLVQFTPAGEKLHISGNLARILKTRFGKQFRQMSGFWIDETENLWHYSRKSGQDIPVTAGTGSSKHMTLMRGKQWWTENGRMDSWVWKSFVAHMFLEELKMPQFIYKK